MTANQNFKIFADGSMEAKNGIFNGNVNTTSIDRFSKYVKVTNTTTGEVGILSGGYLGIGGIETNSNVMYANIYGGDPSTPSGTPFIILYNNGNETYISTNTVNFSNASVRCKSLLVSGSKNRIVETQSFGIVAQSAYETAGPMFGDMGHGVINEFGECTIFIDPKFAETVSTECGYYVFITKCSNGDAWVEKKELTTFTIFGTPGLEFDWEIKAHQKGYESDKLKQIELPS